MREAFAAAAEPFEGFHDDATVGERLAWAGFTEVAVPEDGRLAVASLCRAREALAYRSAYADAVLAVIGLGTHPILVAGSEAQKTRYLGSARAGRSICGFALTEPEAGSDASALQTVARRDGDWFVVDGKKTFTSNAPIAQWFTLFAKTEHGAPVALIVERGDPGVSIMEDVPLSVPHPIGSIVLRAARIPADRLVGAEGDGLRLAFDTLGEYRVTVAAAACGMASRAIDETVARVRARKQFGRALADFQLTRARLADSVTELHAARGLVRSACEAIAEGAADRALKVAMAKLFATEAAQRIIDGAVQLHGGLGVVRGVKVEELYREIRSLRIYEGTSEIQKLIIAKELLGSMPIS
jgi:acyl-CoA dehydrogenase